MTGPEFQTQMNRLIETFGKNVYGTERIALIWREIQSLGADWWTQTVDRFIGECRQAPLMAEIREAAIRERERNWRDQKKRNEREAKEFASLFPREETAMICEAVINKITHRLDEEKFKSVLNLLESASQLAQKTRCRHCCDSGLVFTRNEKGYESVYRCVCAEGLKQPQTYASYFAKIRSA